MISHIQNEILKQKNFAGSGLEGKPKLLNAFFSKLVLCQNYETLHTRFNSGSFSSTDLKFGSFIAK